MNCRPTPLNERSARGSIHRRSVTYPKRRKDDSFRRFSNEIENCERSALDTCEGYLLAPSRAPLLDVVAVDLIDGLVLQELKFSFQYSDDFDRYDAVLCGVGLVVFFDIIK